MNQREGGRSTGGTRGKWHAKHFSNNTSVTEIKFFIMEFLNTLNNLLTKLAVQIVYTSKPSLTFRPSRSSQPSFPSWPFAFSSPLYPFVPHDSLYHLYSLGPLFPQPYLYFPPSRPFPSSLPSSLYTFSDRSTFCALWAHFIFFSLSVLSSFSALSLSPYSTCFVPSLLHSLSAIPSLSSLFSLPFRSSLSYPPSLPIFPSYLSLLFRPSSPLHLLYLVAFCYPLGLLYLLAILTFKAISDLSLPLRHIASLLLTLRLHTSPCPHDSIPAFWAQSDISLSLFMSNSVEHF